MPNIDAPRYAVIVDGDVIHRSESSSLAIGAFQAVLASGDYLELTIQNCRAIRDMAAMVLQQTKEMIA